MQERHQDRKQYFKEQGITTRKFVIPYIEEVIPIIKDSRILEIGCGEGGNMTHFLEMGCEVVGVDLNTKQINNAKIYLEEAVPNANIRLLNKDIYEVSTEEIGLFDVIMLRDVIEHIPNQGKFLKHLHTFLKPNGKVFFGFPPWWMPFGGHQQVCRNKFLSKLPYYHLFPTGIYRAILKAGGESERRIDELIEIKETGISTNRFERIVEENGFQFEKKTFYLINPNYETKFGLKPRVQAAVVSAIPNLKEFVTTCCYAVIGKKT